MSLLRITIYRRHVIVLYCAMALAIIIGLLFFFFTIFQCSPVDLFWNRLTKSGTCLDVNVLIAIGYVYSAGAAVTDLTIGLLPVFIIWNLKMHRRSKLAIVGILSIGCMFVVATRGWQCDTDQYNSASAAVIIRAPYIKHYKDRNFLCEQPAPWQRLFVP